MSNQPNKIEKINELKEKAHFFNGLILKAKKYSQEDPEIALAQARKSAEAICQAIFIAEIGEPGKIMFDELIRKINEKKLLPKQVLLHLGTIQAFGNYGAHAQVDEQTTSDIDITPCMAALDTVAKWFFSVYLKIEHELEISSSTECKLDESTLGQSQVGSVVSSISANVPTQKSANESMPLGSDEIAKEITEGPENKIKSVIYFCWNCKRGIKKHLQGDTRCPYCNYYFDPRFSKIVVSSVGVSPDIGTYLQDDIKEVLRLSRDEAIRLGWKDSMLPQHLFLGIIRYGNGRANDFLCELKGATDKITEQIIEIYNLRCPYSDTHPTSECFDIIDHIDFWKKVMDQLVRNNKNVITQEIIFKALILVDPGDSISRWSGYANKGHFFQAFNEFINSHHQNEILTSISTISKKEEPNNNLVPNQNNNRSKSFNLNLDSNKSKISSPEVIFMPSQSDEARTSQTLSLNIPKYPEEFLSLYCCPWCGAKHEPTDKKIRCSNCSHRFGPKRGKVCAVNGVLVPARITSFLSTATRKVLKLSHDEAVRCNAAICMDEITILIGIIRSEEGPAFNFLKEQTGDIRQMIKQIEIDEYSEYRGDKANRTDFFIIKLCRFRAFRTEEG